MKPAAWAEMLLARHWWQPGRTWLSWVLQPLAWLYGRLRQFDRARSRPAHPPVPVIVVGNLVAGGAGKTPTVIALVQALAALGHKPGVVSRGYGRSGPALPAVQAVQADSTPLAVGDEPWVIQRRTGVPVWVGQDRLAACRALCLAHPGTDVLVLDDGLQHHALLPDAAVVVFDERGVGNGALLPAGPLREPLPAAMPAHWRVLYTAGARSTAWPGALAQRQMGQAWPLDAWHAGDPNRCLPLQALRGRHLIAAAGLAAPEKFFNMLEDLGLRIQRLPLPDHHAYKTLPWPPGTTEVITTEKDAAKLAPSKTGATRVWVVPLDLLLPDGFTSELLTLLGRAPHNPRP